MKHGKLTVKQLAFCAMAIATNRSFQYQLFHFPHRRLHYFTFHAGDHVPAATGSVWVRYLRTGVAYGVLQLLTRSYVLSPCNEVVDYLLAFALGLSSLFSKSARTDQEKGYVAGSWKYVDVAVISGWIFFWLLCKAGIPCLTPSQCNLYLPSLTPLNSGNFKRTSFGLAEFVCK